MPVEDNMYDDEQLAQMRAGQKDPLALYLIVRKSLNMSPGKTAAQCAHAAQMVLLKCFEIKEMLMAVPQRQHDPDADPETFEAFAYFASKRVQVADMIAWMHESFRKIVLVADDKDWEKIKDELDCFVVKDAGLTEVETGSETVLALWPIRKSECPKRIKRLRVLK